MSIKNELEVDIKRFFEQIETQDSNDKKETLRLLMDKYIHLSKSNYIMDNHDLNTIMSNAKNLFVQKTFPAFLGKRKVQVSQGEQSNLCVIEATIGHLNKKDCLKRMPKFDYKENK